MKQYTLKAKPITTGSLPETFDQELNTAQKEAVYFDKGPLLVIAGAGSGKTKTLVYRVAKLVAGGIDPKAILLLTFTRKSSQEMLRRASTVLDSRCQDVSGGTFHAFSNILLRQYASKLGYASNFTILDRADAEDIIQKIRKDLGYPKIDKRFPKKGTINSIISKSINTNKSIANIIEKDYSQFTEFIPDIIRVSKAYVSQKQVMQVMDYDDMLVNLYLLLEQHEDVRLRMQEQFQYIMVDEYQDTNALQSKIIRNLVNTQRNIMVVGDDSQSIYSFRGADFRNIMQFPDEYPNTRVITLEQNYRSVQPILDLTNAIIAKSRDKYSKMLFTEKESEQKPVYVETDSENAQSRFICQKILDLREEGLPLDKVCVLMRSGWHSNDLEVELSAHNIPFQKFGGFKFVETSHVKDVISFLKVIFNPNDGISWNRILGLLEGVGPKAVQTILEYLQSNKANVFFEDLKPFKKKAYYKDLKMMLELIFVKTANQKPSEMLATTIDYYEPHFKLKYDDFNKRTSDLESIQAIADRFDSLETMLTEMSLDPPNASQTDSEPEIGDDEKITLSTIHSAKGLEWDSVFLLSAIDGYIPSFQSLGDAAQIEEERRLLYVALTRAERNLFIIKPHLNFSGGRHYQFAMAGMQFSKISQFLEQDNLVGDFTEKLSIVEEKKPGFSTKKIDTGGGQFTTDRFGNYIAPASSGDSRKYSF